MSDNWTRINLGEVLELITKGTTPPRGKGFVESGGINYIKSDAISYDGQIDTSKFVQIDEETHEKFKRSQIKASDILFSMAGAFLGKNAVVPEHLLPANTNQALAIIRVDRTKALPRFISYGLRNPSMVSYVNSMTAQSAQPNINFKEISSLPFNLPPLPEQKAIAHILGKLDDKIELNRQMNQTLEAMAQALFKSWFVDFDQVIDNAMAAGNTIPEALHAKAEKRQLVPHAKKLLYINPPLAAQFPSAFVFNETLNKWIPKGWEVKDLGDVAMPKKGKNITKKNVITGIVPVVAGGLKPSTYHNQSNTETPVITLSASGANAGYVNLYQSPVWSSDSSFIDSTITQYVYTVFLFLKKNQKTLFEMQEGSAQPHIYPRHIASLPFFLADETILGHFEKIVESNFVKIKNSQLETETLTQLRDTLLPQLISGKVRVPEGLVDKEIA